MEKKMMAMCGTYCGVCEWRDKTNCAGCQECQGDMFFGKCDMAKCCISKEYEHCGLCPDVPCQMLLDLFNDKEHGDKGARIKNLKNWAKGNLVFEKLR